MSRLFLFRHAKASWAEPGMRDFNRKLSPEGIEEAQRIGVALRKRGLIPTQIICSAADRARETFDAIDQNDGWRENVTFTDTLYSTDAPGYLEVASEMGHDGDLMLIGHNPMLEDLAIALGQTGNDEAYTHINMGFGTACVAILKFDGPMSNIQETKWTLEDYLRPRDL
ncbi:SixA phosphatase family protein [Ahrensia kielensis]|uniref:SixA phosphatase family protein n=1 Tax=Ahrensia kielensis TaxID=76980 RepID=UPI000475DB5C|nr:histidine phosphatase family protein [Ahrensia kielensis]